MTASVFLQSIIERVEDLVEQVQGFSKEMTPVELNRKPDTNHWSSGQIFQHMILAAEPYTALMRAAVGQARRVTADSELFHSWFGRMIIKASGPSSNVPAPKKLHPPEGGYGPETIERWIALHQELIHLAQDAYGIDLSAVPMRSPFMPLFKMNLADFFEVLTVHAERHIGQIEKLHREMRVAVS